MVSDMIVSIGLVVFLLLWVGFHPETTKTIKFLSWIAAFTFSALIPLSLINIAGTPLIFFRAFMTLYIIGWAGILLVSLKLILIAFGLISPKRKK